MLTTDTLIIAGILISGGLMALLPILKDPVNRDKKSKWLIGKFNWVAYTIIGLFVIGVLLGLWKENRDKSERKGERNEDRKEFSKQLNSMSEKNRNDLIETRKYIGDSMTIIYNKESEKRKNQMDSIEESRQRKLTSVDKLKLVKRINDVIKQNNLSNNIAIAIACPLGNEEARKYAHEVYFFLKGKGYNLVYPRGSIGDGLIGSSSGNESKGFWIMYDNRDRIMNIDVGVIGSRP